MMQQQMPVEKTGETSQLQFPNKVDEMPVDVQRQTFMVVPQIQVVEKTVEGPQLQIVERIEKTTRDPDDPGRSNL